MATPGQVPRVAIIILNWNGREDTLECLNSLQRLEYAKYDIIVVDNGSTDGAVDVIRARFPEVTLLINPHNLGFAEGNNMGLRHALQNGADYALILNNDTVVAPSMVRQLVETAEAHPRAGLVGPKIYYYDQRDTLWYAGAREQWLRRIPATVGLDEVDVGQYDQMTETDFVYGTAMLIRRQVLQEVGFLDARFFAYHEDADFCLRVQRAGFWCMYDPRAVMWHKVSAATRHVSCVQDYLRGRGRMLFFAQHLQGLRLTLVLIYELYRLAKVWVWAARDRRLKNARAYTKGLWDGARLFVWPASRAAQDNEDILLTLENYT